MQITIHGPGMVDIRLIDKEGQTLHHQQLRFGGHEDVHLTRELPLNIETDQGSLPVAPVLVTCAKKQRVQFDGEDARSFTRRRCKEIGCSAETQADAERGDIPALDLDQVKAPESSRRGKGK